MQENIANNRTLEVEHIHALEMLSATSAYPQAQLEAASPKVQLTSPVTTLNVHPTAAEGHIEPPKPVQLCALPPQMPAGPYQPEISASPPCLLKKSFLSKIKISQH